MTILVIIMLVVIIRAVIVVLNSSNQQHLFVTLEFNTENLKRILSFSGVPLYSTHFCVHMIVTFKEDLPLLR